MRSRANVRNSECPIGRIAIATETELKLTAQPADLPKLQRALAALSSQTVGAPISLISTYYDTADLALQRRGIILRIREQQGRFIQTVKTAGPSGEDWFARGEWEDLVAGDRPDLDAPESGGHVPKEVGGALRPIFVTDVKRSTTTITPGDVGRIEAAIDRGRIRAGDRVARISEIELELRDGPPVLLYELAERLLEAAPFHLDARSKAERGFRLAAAESALTAVHADPVAIEADMSERTALRQIARACLGHFLRNQPAALMRNPEAVHQMRVALRRLRSALVAFNSEVPPAEWHRTADTLRQLNRNLGRVRNLDVLAGELLPPVRAAFPHESDLDHLATAIDWARHNAHARLAGELGSPRDTATMLRLLRWFEIWGDVSCRAEERAAAPTAVGDGAARYIDRHWRAVLRRSKRFRRQSARQRHRLRIAVKKLRYTIETFGSLFAAERSEKFVKRLRRLQDELGYANDVRVAGELIAELCVQAEPGGRLARAGTLVLDWHERRLAERQRKLRKRLRRLRHAASFWREPEAGQPG